MRILLIHGRAQGGQVADELKSTWVETLRAGYSLASRPWSDAVQVDFPYYADVLDHFAAQAELPLPQDVLAKGGGHDPQFEQFLHGALAEIQAGADIPDDEVRAELAPGQPQEKGIENWPWTQALIRVIDGRFPRVTGYTVQKVLRDVYLYITHREVARQVDAIVEEKLTNEPTLVVGHSLGSVVAYNLLRKHRRNVQLRKFVTVGSPLGLRVISSKLGVPENPAGKVGWFNAYDERDVVALNPLDEVYFPVDPPVANYNRVRNDTDNRHGIIGYLNDPVIAGQIAAALNGGS